ncbi:hypothetical protein FLAG1_11738 [Fusarium langsethiae]|uniref:Heterokaryon incompatibility domain-containing protein n=1 Tax=Fusarium langsethiae TaxID=179993 RepID=A0A0M9EM44_FUSLA|nr:hypothetical protein FLAG1_11738 [Fusarium langsethiae]GKU05145.1 unnamed protein product [Fusarium langsethiae]GKU22269.1 unnamed protein product [Fusarium langsethiae]
MTICSLCSPALSSPSRLPTLPESWNQGCAIEESSSTPYFMASKDNNTPPEKIGLPHHVGLDGLTESAKECPLCELILERVGKFMNGLKKAGQNAHYRYFVLERQGHGIPEEWSFKLVQRLDGGDGFAVLADSKNRRYMYLMDVFGYCVDPADSLYSTMTRGTGGADVSLPKGKIRGSKVGPDAGSEETLSVVTGWLKDCVQSHDRCQPAETRLPSRILDLEALNDPNKIRLLETAGDKKYGSYVTLSYCWGSDPTFHVRTTHSSLPSHLDSIDVDSLPQTHKDAIKITRHVGVRFLWIDSLCICQDDSEDWARESAAMQQVYAGAYLSIAADNASGSEEGFLARPDRRYIPVTIKTLGEAGDDDSIGVNDVAGYAFQVPPVKAYHNRAWMIFNKEPLTKRGWAMQERLLPIRALHFGNDQMFFECNCHLLSEDGVEVKGRWNSLYPLKEKGFKDIARRSRVSATHQLWYLILEDFFHRMVTVKSDRLPAISGLATMFQSKLTDEMVSISGSGNVQYVAGLWSNALVEGLGWSALGKKEDKVLPDKKPLPGSEDYIAPTWSPASFDDVSAHGMTMPGWVDVATILDFSVTPKTMHNPFGEVIDGWIRTRGPTIKLSLSELPDEDQEKLGTWRRNMRLCTPRGNAYGSYCSIDGVHGQNEETRAWIKDNGIFALILSGKKHDGDETMEGSTYHALLTMPVSQDMRVVPGRNEFRRVGTIFLGDDQLGDDIESVEDNEGFVEIVLV